MKIAIDKNLVEFTPANEDEAKQIDTLWKILIDCVGSSKKLVPVGEYLPGQSEFARFAIED